MSAPTVTVYGLEKSFGSANILSGVDLTIYPSKINFIIGQSGGGKSVLLKHLVGLMEPDCGGIWYDNQLMTGQPPRHWAELRRRMALLFQDGALFDSMTVGQNVAFPLWFSGRAGRKIADELARKRLDELDMGGAFGYRTSDLSSGEKKRVALARALIMEPEILFFDEPTTGLDPLLSDQVDNLISQTSELTQATIVVVSHDIPATLSLAQHIAMIYEGRIHLAGSPSIFKNSQDPVIKQFLSGDAEGPISYLD